MPGEIVLTLKVSAMKEITMAKRKKVLQMDMTDEDEKLLKELWSQVKWTPAQVEAQRKFLERVTKADKRARP